MSGDIPRWRTIIVASVLSLALAGCDSQINSVRNATTHVRVNLERRDSANRLADENREARIMASGQAMARREEAQNNLLPPDSPNYALRHDANGGWSVIDTATRKPVATNAQNLSLSRAQGMLTNMSANDPNAPGAPSGLR